jgi:hypothetical protein
MQCECLRPLGWTTVSLLAETEIFSPTIPRLTLVPNHPPMQELPVTPCQDKVARALT